MVELYSKKHGAVELRIIRLIQRSSMRVSSFKRTFFMYTCMQENSTITVFCSQMATNSTKNVFSYMNIAHHVTIQHSKM